MFAMFMEPVIYRVFPPTLSELPVAVTVALFVGVPLLMLVGVERRTAPEHTDGGPVHAAGRARVVPPFTARFTGIR